VTLPEALILAGPNGAGKTTSSALLVPAETRFVNPDAIAAQLLEEGHPTAGVDVAAGRIILEQLRALVAADESFCVETNLAGRGFVRWIGDWRTRGYTVRLVFTALDSPEMALRRVAARVASGGHNVPEAVVRRRWSAGLRVLFDVYLPLVDRWQIFDGSDLPVREVARGGPAGLVTQTLDEGRWRRLLMLAVQSGATASWSGGELFDPVTSVDDDGQSQP
jgi:predicted ABC-type ATPase